MYVLILLIVIVLSLIIFGSFEYYLHQKRVYAIPIRIHVNGTRGKSSVSRLIGAGLREAGLKTITKVTGTYPRLILEDGTETLIHRKSDPNIFEQVSTIKFAKRRKVDALVLECMALQPLYQKLTEQQMIHATVSVITNVRLDHIDVMGKTLHEIADTLSLTIPKKGLLFTAEKNIFEYLSDKAKKKKTEIILSDSASVKLDEMTPFKYIEHKENVALALMVCGHFNIDRNIALRGMYKTIPDAGALNRFIIKAFGKEIKFFNAFAANDPESTLMIWNRIKEEVEDFGSVIFLLNNRQDRFDRGRQLAEMLGEKLKDHLDILTLIGDSTDVIANIASASGISKDRIINIGQKTPAFVFEKILSLTKNRSSVIAIGNMGKMGAKVAEYYQHRDYHND